MPIIGVCDARDPLQFWLGEAKDKIPVLILEDETWEESVTHLVKNAAVLVVHCLYLSPGVERELEIISKFQRQDSTIVVLPPPDEDPLAGIPVTQTGPGGTIMSRNFTKATPGDRRFRQYAAVIGENQTPNDFAALPGIKRLLEPKTVNGEKKGDRRNY
jgi:hypothetical protein